MEKLYTALFSQKVVKRLERLTLVSSIVGFLIHLLLVGLYHIGIFPNMSADLFENPISAIYTPFSFILVFEIYILIYYLPRSFTTSLLKQFEIIALILIRRIFGDIAKIDLSLISFTNQEVIQLLVDLISVLVLLTIIVFFTRIRNQLIGRKLLEPAENSEQTFRLYKKRLAVVLIGIIAVISVIHLVDYIYVTTSAVHLFKGMENNLNAIFYKDFFTVLILCDVLVLLLSYGLTKENFKLLRNTGFVITTVLIRLSFSIEGIYNSLFIISGALFGLAILKIYASFSEIDQTFEE